VFFLIGFLKVKFLALSTVVNTLNMHACMDVERRFEKVELDFDEDVNILKDEIRKLEKLLKKIVKK